MTDLIEGTLLYPKQLEAIRRHFPLTDECEQLLMVEEDVTPGCDLMPGWFIGTQLYVWCEQHFRWNEHGYIPGERFQYRVDHHSGRVEAHKNSICIVVIGEARGELRKQLLNYPTKNVHTPPPYSFRVVVSLKQVSEGVGILKYPGFRSLWPASPSEVKQ